MTRHLSDPVTRTAAYLTELEPVLKTVHTSRFAPFWTQPSRQGEWFGPSGIQKTMALLYAVLYRHTANDCYLTLARSFFLAYCRNRPDGAEHFHALMIARAYEILQPHLIPAERAEFAQRWVGGVPDFLARFVNPDPATVEKWDNASNHAIGACLYADLVRKWFPDESRAGRFEQHTDRVWQVWWTRREFQEQASNYEGFAELFLCEWAALRGLTTEFYRSPSVRNMFARNTRIVSPAGIVTAYADSGHYEHALPWLALFEKVATETGDPDFANLAEEVFTAARLAGLRRQSRVLRGLLDENLYAGRSAYCLFLHSLSHLALAALWTRQPGDPERRRMVTGVNARLPHGYVLTAPDATRLPEAQLIPCQVALTGGDPDPRRQTYVLLSAGPKLVHDHADAGAILMLSQGRTCLLGTNGYLLRELLYHNVFFVQPTALPVYPDDTPDKAFAGNPACRAQVELLAVDGRTAGCRLHFDEYHGYPVTLTREVMVLHDGSVEVLDRVRAQTAGWCGGPLFHAQKIRRVGPQTYLLRTDVLRSFNGQEWTNGSQALRVAVESPTASCIIRFPAQPAVYQVPVYSAFPCRHYRRIWQRSYTARQCLAVSQTFEPGKTYVFLTRLTACG